jgi:hypothetical protein
MRHSLKKAKKEQDKLKEEMREKEVLVVMSAVKEARFVFLQQ